MPLITAILVVVFGGLTIWLNNPIFIKMKPTLGLFIFSAILGYGLLKKKIYLKILMGPAIPMNEEGWLILSKDLLTFVLLAFTNEIIWNFSHKIFGLILKLLGCNSFNIFHGITSLIYL